jgi:hypothetical protein
MASPRRNGQGSHRHGEVATAVESIYAKSVSVPRPIIAAATLYSSRRLYLNHFKDKLGAKCPSR